jgi:hypothetical protein
MTCFCFLKITFSIHPVIDKDGIMTASTFGPSADVPIQAGAISHARAHENARVIHAETLDEVRRIIVEGVSRCQYLSRERKIGHPWTSFEVAEAAKAIWFLFDIWPTIGLKVISVLNQHDFAVLEKCDSHRLFPKLRTKAFDVFQQGVATIDAASEFLMGEFPCVPPYSKIEPKSPFHICSTAEKRDELANDLINSLRQIYLKFGEIDDDVFDDWSLAVRCEIRSSRLVHTAKDEIEVPGSVPVSVSRLPACILEENKTVQLKGCELNVEAMATLGDSAENTPAPKVPEDSNSLEAIDWLTVQKHLYTIYVNGGVYASMKDLARQVGCKSKSTVAKAFRPPSEALRKLNIKEKMAAIKRGHSLVGWMARSKEDSAKAARKAISLTDCVTDNMVQKTERNPASFEPKNDIDVAMAKLIDEADDDRRAKLNAMSPDEQRDLIMAIQDSDRDYDPSPLDDRGKSPTVYQKA